MTFLSCLYTRVKVVRHFIINFVDELEAGNMFYWAIKQTQGLSKALMKN